MSLDGRSYSRNALNTLKKNYNYITNRVFSITYFRFEFDVADASRD